MSEIRYTLVSDGSSDRVLLPILTWLVRQHTSDCPIQPEWADLRGLRQPITTLAEKIRWSLFLYPCDIIFIHRDAERQPREDRVTEIEEATRIAAQFTSCPPLVCVVPVRMQEAWLLFDEAAVRRAAGNPHGHERLGLPLLADIENLPNPKRVLHDTLRIASGLHGRRRRSLPVHLYVHRVADLIEDYSPLRSLSAFHALESDVQHLLSSWR
jgi:hypothetical protein